MLLKSTGLHTHSVTGGEKSVCGDTELLSCRRQLDIPQFIVLVSQPLLNSQVLLFPRISREPVGTDVSHDQIICWKEPSAASQFLPVKKLCYKPLILCLAHTLPSQGSVIGG